MMYQPSTQLVLRTPRLPVQSAFVSVSLTALVQDALFMEAVYLASPVLYQECMRYKEGKLNDEKEIKKIHHSLLKYHSRMSSRCTPFGLFSGCSVAAWAINDEPTAIVLPTANGIERHTRLDMHYLCALAQQIAKWPAVKENILFFPNTSLYTIGEDWRYVEYHYINGKRNHHISAATASSYLNMVIDASKEGVTTEQLTAILINDEITAEDAEGFIEQLIESHILISELEPAITGAEFIVQITNVLQRINQTQHNEGIHQIIGVLTKVHQMIVTADANVMNPAHIYHEIQNVLTILEVPFDAGKLFQTDVVKNPVTAIIGNDIKEQIHETLTLLNLLTAKEDNENLKRFANRFYERYEEKEMPLLDVLDTETGIGYLEHKDGDLTPLVDELYVPGPQQTNHQLKWGMMENFLTEKLNDTIKQQQTNISITDDDVTQLTATYKLQENWNNLPPSFSVMFRLVNGGAASNNTSTDNCILFEHAGNSSAANLLGRFAHADEKINELVQSITKQEALYNPDIVFAEIVHLPESRIGNILLHPVFREYEIPYLAKSSLAQEHQITLQDLSVCVKGGEVILWSKKLSKRIIPRLSSAHNFSYNAQPVYQFLCDLQTQGLRSGLYFSWGSIEIQQKFLPRVMYKNIILSPAKWSLQKKDYELLLNAKQDELTGAIQSFLQLWELPQYTVLADGDNELMIDWQNTSHTAMFLETVKNRPVIQLKEFIYSTSGIISDTNGDVYNNQFIASYIKEQATYSAYNGIAKQETNIQRKFEPGSEWLYYKLYCGIKTADKILEQAIMPLTEKLVKENLIHKWFFIRYNDPHFHLRIRFHVKDTDHNGMVMQYFKEAVEPFLKDELIWKCSTDTYTRELERYGHDTVELSESLFCEDSNTVLHMLSLTEGDEREHLRWLWAMRSIDEWLNAFDYSLQDKLQLLELLKTGFAAEFSTGKPVQQQLSDLYRKHKKEIEKIMSVKADDENERAPLVEILNLRTEKIKPLAQILLQQSVAGLLHTSMNNLMGSYIHMIMNRICTSKARMQEMVTYDFLYCYYKSQQARAKFSINKNQLVQVNEKFQ